MKRKSSKTDTYSIELTPVQRLLMLPAFRRFAGPFENREQGRVFRALHEALALPVIGRSADLHGGNISAKQATSRALRMFTIDWHQLQMFKRVLDGVQRDGNAELELGPLLDQVDDLVGGKDVPAAGAPPFVAEEENWDPPHGEPNKQ